jgi:hypothetical protein
MKKIAIIVTILFWLPLYTSAQPVIGADPCGECSEFFILTVDGEELEPIPCEAKHNWILFKDLAGLGLLDGFHEMKMRTCTEGEESAEIIFFVEIGTYEGYRLFEIVPDPENKDLNYLGKFDYDHMVAQVFNDGKVVVNPKPKPPGVNGNNCFINTVRKF